MNNEYELKQGQALVLTGPQGCGKTILARNIAEQYGPFIETDIMQLKSRREFNDLIATEPSTVICDGIPDSEETRAWVKQMIAGDEVMLERKNREPKMVKAPNFIFCTGDAHALQMGAEERRFRVVQVGASA